MNESELKLRGPQVEDILKRAYGGTIDKASGGVVEGPTHEQGGVPTYDNQTGEEIAEVEGNGIGVDGGERIFSTDDTAAMEEAAMQIIEAIDAGDQQSADELAKQLGYAIVNMIAAQEQNQGAAEAGGADPAAEQAAMQEAEMMNQFGPVE